MLKFKYLLFILALLVITISCLNLPRKGEIMAVDRELNFANVAVKHFPLTDNGKVDWWRDHKQILKEKFSIPVPAKNGDWYISVWNYGDGFKAKPNGDIRIFNADTQDMLCFNNDDGKCIDKDLLMRIEGNRDGSVDIQVGDKTIAIKS
ncbi:DUF943 family protein [Pseudescherichia vulneris]|nr:DUF943 family protein [Pseudescherichia vulneris]STQ61585.1 Enterobacterial putative membrane protein (DUF943) [Pseudescherichia vulneris]